MIRPATVEDARGIAEVHVRTWQAAYGHAFPAELLDSLDVDERELRWRDNVVDPQAPTWVADEDGIVGFVSVGPSPDPDCDGELYGLYVAPEAWGSGAGAALMDTALAYLRERFEQAVLWVLEDNPRARRFYEKHGWTLDGATKRDTHFGAAVDEVRYRIGFSL